MLGRRELAAFALAFLVTLPAVTARLYASDEVQYFAWLRSVTFDRDVDFDNEYRRLHASVVNNDLFYATFLDDEKLNEAGRRLNFGPVGSAVLWAPFYAVGHVVARLTGAPADGYSQPYISAVAIGSAVYGAIAILLSASIARRVVGHGLRSSLVIACGTPLLFYIYVAPPFAHANSAFAVSLFLWTWLGVRKTWTPRGAALVGLTGALMAMVREQDLFFVAGPLLDLARTAVAGWRARGRKPANRLAFQSAPPGQLAVTALAGGAAFVAAFSLQLAAYKALNGHFGPTIYSTRKMSWTSPHALGVLVDPAHGFFFWTPLALVAIAGLLLLASGRLARARHDAAWIGALALVMFALQVYVSGSVESWTVAGSFGQRRFVAATPLLTLGLAALWPAASGRGARSVFAAAVAVCVWWNVALMALFGTHRMDRQRLTLDQNIRAAFIDLPLEAPALAWRYLTDRSSFYQQPRQ